MYSLSAGRPATAIAAAALLGACSSAYGEAVDPAADGGPAHVDEAGGEDARAEGGAFDGGGNVPDAAPACVPPKKANGLPCAAEGDCCSNVCTEARTCGNTCKKSGSLAFSCSPGGNDCCVGAYCSVANNERCTTCIADGANAEVYNSVPIAASCCSRKVNAGKCAP